MHVMGGKILYSGRMQFCIFIYFISSPHDTLGQDIMFSGCCPPRLFFRSSGQILLSRCLVNALNNLNRSYREYLIVMTYLDSGGQRSKVKVTAGGRGDEGICVDAVHFLVVLSLFRYFLFTTLCGRLC